LCAILSLHPYQSSLRTSAEQQNKKGELTMTDNAEKNQGHNQEQSGQQQEKHPQDISKKNPSQDSNKEQSNKQGQQDQGGQRRVS
jgi:hypothetical protein